MTSEMKPSPVRGLEFYTKYADDKDIPKYNYRGLQMHGMPGLHEKIVEYAKTHLSPGSTILDLGCGSGALCLRLLDNGFSPTGADAVAEGFKAREHIPFQSIDLNSNFSEKFDTKFDAITATELIEHLENPRHFLRQCRLLVKEGGKIFLTTPNIDSPMAKAYYVRTGDFWLYSDDLYHSIGHIMPISKFLLKKSMEETGFQINILTSFAGWGSFMDWFKMRILAALFRALATSPSEEGQILVVTASAGPGSNSSL